MRKRRWIGLVGGVLAVLGAATPAAADTTTTGLANGATLSVSIDPPTPVHLVPEGATGVDVPVTGSASVGPAASGGLWVYVVDVSFSTRDACDASRTILQCEKQAVRNLNAQIVAAGVPAEVGIVVFAGTAAVADMAATAGPQGTVAASATAFTTVVNSIQEASIGQFTAASVVNGNTNFGAALDAARSIVVGSSASSKNVVLLSDGFSFVDDPVAGRAQFDAAIAAMEDTGAKVFPFAVGADASCAGNGGAQEAGTLDEIAAAVGTSCVHVATPASLPSLITTVVGTELRALDATAGGAPVGIVTSLVLPQAGPATVGFSGTAAGLGSGTHELCATVTGAGPSSGTPATTRACESVDVYAFAATPPAASVDLAVANSHTITATIAGPAGRVSGLPVAFAVTSGPHVGRAGVCAPVDCRTDANGNVAFTLTVPATPASVGTDTVVVSTSIGGISTTRSLAVTWRLTPGAPTATCLPGSNPAGHVPPAGGEGPNARNPDGFFVIGGGNTSGGAVSVTVTDSGTGTTWGPFPAGTTIKYTKTPGGQPSIRPMTGAVDWQLRGRGDAIVIATNELGVPSEPVRCVVPPSNR